MTWPAYVVAAAAAVVLYLIFFCRPHLRVIVYKDTPRGICVFAWSVYANVHAGVRLGNVEVLVVLPYRQRGGDHD